MEIDIKYWSRFKEIFQKSLGFQNILEKFRMFIIFLHKFWGNFGIIFVKFNGKFQKIDEILKEFGETLIKKFSGKYKCQSKFNFSKRFRFLENFVNFYETRFYFRSFEKNFGINFVEFREKLLKTYNQKIWWIPDKSIFCANIIYWSKFKEIFQKV